MVNIGEIRYLRVLKVKPDVLDNCVNPFHYLKLVNSRQAPSRGTCNCSAQLKKKKKKFSEVKNNTKIDDWLIKVRVVEEKKSIKIWKRQIALKIRIILT